MTRHLITSALPYINGVKHLGNLVGSMLPADVYARYLRCTGAEVLYFCATDEHGTPAELAAAEAGMDVAEFCAQQYQVQKSLSDGFGLSFDWFGRTSLPQNHRLTNHFAARLNEQGYIEVRSTDQVYSPADGRFLPDRYVVGECPNCAYDRARGDQCENCGKQLDPTDLISPRSAVSGATDLEVRSSSHAFLLQSQLADRIRAWVDTKTDWPNLTKSIAYKWLDEGLEDRGITRDLDWGIPVDTTVFPELVDKVWYVWFDAPIGYLGATLEWAEAQIRGSAPAPGAEDGSDLTEDQREQAVELLETWWRTDKGADDVIYTQFMGKDNVPFHTLSFPATIIGSGEPWKLVDRLKSFNWLTYYGGKFSTTDQRGVFMSDALELLPADYWRWYLMANSPESDDSSFTWELFGGAVNKDLVGTFGNLINRTLTQITRHYDGVIPTQQPHEEPEQQLWETAEAALSEYCRNLNGLEFRKATQSLRQLWTAGNVYLERREPWKTVKEDRDRTAGTLHEALKLVVVAIVASAPFIPDSVEKMKAIFPTIAWDSLLLNPELLQRVELNVGDALVQPELLFQKLSQEQLDEWSVRFNAPSATD